MPLKGCLKPLVLLLANVASIVTTKSRTSCLVYLNWPVLGFLHQHKLVLPCYCVFPIIYKNTWWWNTDPMLSEMKEDAGMLHHEKHDFEFSMADLWISRPHKYLTQNSIIIPHPPFVAVPLWAVLCDDACQTPTHLFRQSEIICARYIQIYS